MVCKIAFSGYKNVAGISGTLQNKFQDAKLSLQLNNEDGHEDLKDFESVFKKAPDKSHLGFVNIELAKNANGDTMFIVNDKIINTNDENLGIFSKIAKLTRRVAKNPKASLANDYKNSDDLFKNLKISERIIENEKLAPKVAQIVTDEHSVQNSAIFIAKTIQQTMEKYFHVK